MNEMLHQPQAVVAQTGGAAASSDSVSAVSLAVRTVWRVLVERFWLFIGVAAIVFAAGVIITFMLTPQYTAEAILKVDPMPTPITGVQTDARYQVTDRANIQSEVDVIRSRGIAKVVARELGLLNDPEFDYSAGQPFDQPGSSKDIRIEAIASALLDSLVVGLNQDSYIITIDFTSLDPEKAARIANAFAQAYLKGNVGNRTGTAGQQNEWLAKRRAAKEAEVRTADAAVAQYKSSAGIVEGTANGTITDQQVGPLAAQLASAEAESAQARARVASARRQIAAGNLDAVSSVLNSPVVTTLRAQRGQLIQTRDDIRARYGPLHPDTIRVNQQLDSLDEQIKDEAKRLTDALENSAKAADAQAASLRQTLSQLKSEQAHNTRASVIADQLERDAAIKRTAFEELAKAEQQADVAAHNSLTNVQIVQTALAPEVPTKPRKKLLIAGSFLAALLAGAGVIMSLEVLARGIRSIGDVERKLGSRLLTAVPQLPRSILNSMSPADYLTSKPMTRFAESFRKLRSALITQTHGKDMLPKIIAITSSVPSEGKTSVTLALGRAMALAGDKVIIVDGDFRRAGMTFQTHYQSAVTLNDVLQHGADCQSAIRPDTTPGLYILANNEPVFTPVDVFNGQNMAILLDRLTREYDTVLLDTPPFLGMADARSLTAHASSVLVVAAWNSTPIDAVEKTLNQLQLDGASLAGVIVTKVDPNAELIGVDYYSKKYAAYYVE